MKAPPFNNRWCISGSLTTLTELHIGDGGSGELVERHRAARKAKDENGEDEHEAQTVCVDHDGRAFLPSSSIRGVLRSQMIQNGSWAEERWEKLFGSPDPDAPNAMGGKLIFYDGFWRKGSGCQNVGDVPSHPYWSAKRRTCVATSVSLDRRRRTAADRLLYQIEYVPAGEVFEIEIGAENVEEEDIANLLALMQRLNGVGARQPVHVGGLVSNDWGRLKWELSGIERFTREDLAAWRQMANRPVGIQMTKPIAGDVRDRLIANASSLAAKKERHEIEIALMLKLTSPWIVRDARQKERVEESKKRQVPENQRPVGATPLLDESGKPFIPAKSFRGLLNSQAERILRTIGVEVPPPDKKPAISARSSLPEALHQASKLDLAARLFGVSGWRAPLKTSRFILPAHTQPPKLLRQEFVAVDRFTGGAADALKFNAKFAPPCTLEGRLTLDLARLGQVDPEQTARGLLALVLRDLLEGDLAPGAHAAIGCGECTCAATIFDKGQAYPTLQDWFRSQPVKDSLAAFRQSITSTARP